MTTSLFNVRVDDDLSDAIEASAEASGLKKSAWAREVLGAVALGGVTLQDLNDLIKSKGLTDQSPHPERYLSLQGQTGRQESIVRRCIHPLTARKQLAFAQVCGLCGATVKKT